MNLKRFKNWIRENFLWACEPRLVVLCFLVLLSAFLFGFYTWQSEQSIRVSGYVLQMIGMVFAIRGLLNIRAHFGQPTLKRLFIAWLYRRPKWKKHTVKAVGGGIIPVAGLKGRLSEWIPDNPEDLLEKRIDGIIKNVERLKVENRKILEHIDELQRNQEKQHKEQEQARANMENQIRSDLESSQTNDILTSLIGLIWLTFGISMSTMSQELSKIFQ